MGVGYEKAVEERMRMRPLPLLLPLPLPLGTSPSRILGLRHPDVELSRTTAPIHVSIKLNRLAPTRKQRRFKTIGEREEGKKDTIG